MHCIVNFINSKNIYPSLVDSSQQYSWYKENNTDVDITYEYFEHYDNIFTEIQPEINIQREIDYNEWYQFHNYSTLDYVNITPIVKKYFSPSTNVKQTIEHIETKYNLNYENICVLFYRGNDKITETDIGNYNDYLSYANSIYLQNQNIIFLIQSDETEFIEFFTDRFPHNTVYFKDEIRHMNKCNSTVDNTMRNNIGFFSKNYLAITIIMSKCKYIICGSGNCSIWIMLYRGHCENVHQYLNGTWYKHNPISL